jgi:formylglycine-generating enzyme required for sulfatase activity
MAAGAQILAPVPETATTKEMTMRADVMSQFDDQGAAARLWLWLFLFLVPAGLAQAAPGDSLQDCDDCPEMIELPTGKAMLGVEPYEANAKPTDGALRTVRFRQRIAMGRTETSRAQFRRFVDATGYTPVQNGCNTWSSHRILGYVLAHSWHDPGYPQSEQHPVVCVSYVDATAYARWLSELTGQRYRLPSSSEFEYATRAGTRGPWFWGASSKQACEFANVADATFRKHFEMAPVFHCDDGYLHTAPVGSFSPNPWGLSDMLGNAWEWTEDCLHRDMSNAPLDGSAWLEADGGECDRRTPRGGSWVSGTDWVRAGAQAGDRAVYHSQLLGFRLVRELD